MTSILNLLQVPYNKKFTQLPVAHYEALVECYSYPTISHAITELLVYYKDDKKLSEKARTLLSILDKQFLFEKKKDMSSECVCGFKLLGEEYEKCPVCNTPFTKNDKCFYLNDDHSCSQDGKQCTAISRKECNK